MEQNDPKCARTYRLGLILLAVFAFALIVCYVIYPALALLETVFRLHTGDNPSAYPPERWEAEAPVSFIPTVSSSRWIERPIPFFTGNMKRSFFIVWIKQADGNSFFSKPVDFISFLW